MVYVLESSTVRPQNKTRELVFMAFFSALIAIGAFIKIPVPVCPFTLQLLFTTMAGLLLGSRLGSAAVWVYIALGLLGLPVFTNGGGPGYIFQPTFGYLIGFALGAKITGSISAGTVSMKKLLLANFAGLAIVYLCGMAYYYIIGNFVIGQPIALWPLFLYCFLLAVPGDIVLCIIAALLGKKLIPLVRENRR